jgi:phasin family protein
MAKCRIYVAVQKNRICCFFVLLKVLIVLLRSIIYMASKASAKKTIKSVMPAPHAATFDKIKRNVANKVTTTLVTTVANTMETKMQNAAEQFEKANEQISTQLHEVAHFNRDNLEAAVQTVNAVAQGLKDVNQTVFHSLQQSLQSAMTTGKAMMGVRNLRDLMELQSQFIKSTFDTVMADTTKISEIAVRCGSQAAEPINARVTKVVEKVSNSAKRAA